MREAAQAQADRAMADMGVKLNVFRDPFLDRASETEYLMGKIKDLDGGDSTTAGSVPGGSSSGFSPSGKGKGLGQLGAGGIGGR